MASMEGEPRVLCEEEVVLPGGSYIMRMLRGARPSALYCGVT